MAIKLSKTKLKELATSLDAINLRECNLANNI